MLPPYYLSPIYRISIYTISDCDIFVKMFRFFLCFPQVLPYNDFMINTVIFDMDGLLVDSEKAFLETYNELLDA